MHESLKPLTGENNNRLTSINPTNSAINSPLTDVARVKEESLITEPSLHAVVKAKDWVDNGSKL